MSVSWQYPASCRLAASRWYSPHSPLPQGRGLTCGAGAQRTGLGPGSLIAECSQAPPCHPDLSFPTYDLRTSISALSSLPLVSVPTGSHLPCPGIWEVPEGPDCGSCPRGHLLRLSDWGKWASLLVLKEKCSQSPYAPPLALALSPGLLWALSSPHHFPRQPVF